MTNKKYNILTTFNLNCSDQRWNDYLFCLDRNLENSLINHVFIAVEVDDNNQEQRRKYEDISSLSKRIFTHKINNRPTFTELFTFCNNIHGKWIITNSDIYFPKSNADKLSLLLERDYTKECFVLTRYNILDEMEEKKDGIDISYEGMKLRTMHGNNTNEGGSIDSWIFQTPFDLSKVNFDIQLGQPQCDGHMNYELSKLHKVTNPCLSIISIHKHKGWYNWYKKVLFNGKSMKNKEYNKLMEEKGHQQKKIKFTHLPEND